MQSKKNIVNSLISIVFMFIGLFLPAMGPISETGVAILFAFIGAIWGWCTVNMIWPSILALFVLGLSGYTSVIGAFQAAASNPTVLMVLFLMAFSSILQSTGITQRIAMWMISRSFTKGHPWILSFMILIAAWLPSMFVGLTPPIIIVWAIIYSIAKETGLKRGDKWISLMCFAVVFFATLGVNSVPFQVGVVANFGLMTAATEGAYTLNYTYFLVFSCIMSIILMLVFLLLARFIFRADVSKLIHYEAKATAIEPMDGAAKIAIILFALLVIILMLPFLLPEGNVLRIFLQTNVDTTTCCILAVALALIVQYKGKPFTSFSTLVTQGVAWEVIFMLAAAFTLSSAVTAEGIGISDALQHFISPLLSGNNVFIFIGSLLFIALILTNLINNVVVSAIMVPIACKVAMTTGIVNPIILTSLFILVIDLGFVLPSSSVGGAMLHGNPDWLPKRDILIYGTIIVFATAIVCLFVGYPLAHLIF